MAGVAEMTLVGMAGVITAVLVATVNATAPLHIASGHMAAGMEVDKGLPTPSSMLWCNQLSSCCRLSFLK